VSATASKLPEILERAESDILAEWLREQQQSVSRRRDLLPDRDLERQSREFLDLFREATQDGDPGLLDDVGDRLVGPDVAAGHPAQGRMEPLDDVGEGALVAAPQGGDERRVVDARRRDHRRILDQDGAPARHGRRRRLVAGRPAGRQHGAAVRPSR